MKFLIDAQLPPGLVNGGNTGCVKAVNELYP
jgi:hypothetical protein